MLLRCGLRSLAMAEMGTGGQEIKAGLFCCNSELDELRNRKLLVSKHESHHVVFESGSGFVRALIGYSSLSPPPEERVRPVRIGRAAFPNTGYYFFAMDCAAEFLIAGTSISDPCCCSEPKNKSSPSFSFTSTQSNCPPLA
jgi:hypothetical protein